MKQKRIFIALFTQLKRFGYSENFLTLITGIFIFYPVCFVSNPVHAIIMGVTMHYTQYLYLTYNVYNSRNQELGEKIDGLAETMGNFCARSAFKGSDLFMDTKEKKHDVSLFQKNMDQ